MKKIAVFGGAFDPVHLGHQTVTQILLARKIVDQVWYVPVYRHPWADKLNKQHLTDYQHRVAMLESILEPDSRVQHYKNVSFAYPTLQYFAHQHPDHQFYWVMGSEYLAKFDLFLEGHPRLLDFPFLIYPRFGHPTQPLWDNMTLLDQVEPINISSTQVRQALQAGQPIDHLVDSKVAAYLQDHVTMWS